MHTPVGTLDEEIVTHERPTLIEYTVVNDDDTTIHNHLGRIELTEAGTGGTRLDYTIASTTGLRGGAPDRRRHAARLGAARPAPAREALRRLRRPCSCRR